MFPRTTLFAAPLFALALVVPTAAAQPTTWGSLDGTRSGNPLTTSASLSGLRGKVTANGDVIGAAAATLDSSYLSGVDVLFTGLLGGSSLAAAEKTDLDAWLTAGGTLIVTADNGSIAALDSFTANHAITAFASGKTGTDGFVFDPSQHPSVTGMTGSVPYTNLANLWSNGPTYPLFLAGNNYEDTIIMAQEAGSVGQGKILAVGTDALWLNGATGDAGLFQDNVVGWASNGGSSGCGTTASFANYGAGHPGTNGVPALSLDANPVIGAPVGLVIGNSAGVDATTLLLLGASQTSIVSGLGGTLLVTPTIQATFTTPAAGATLPSAVPNDGALCGVSVYLQALQADAGASVGVSFTPGLQVTFGS